MAVVNEKKQKEQPTALELLKKAQEENQKKAAEQAWVKKVADKTGATKTRDYLYSLGQSRGMTKDEIDNLIGWSASTGEVSFGGKKIGKPDAAYDGVSYWKDTSVLDKAFNDWVARSGHTISDSMIADQYKTGIKDKGEQYWNTIAGDRDKYYSEFDKVSGYVNSDVTKSDEYKSTFDNIMSKYDLDAMQGRDNVAASGAAYNGGNVDSYAAANALRQQAALTAQGQALAHQMGLEAYQSRVNNARNLLSDLGIYQKDSWAGMESAIGLQQSEAQRLFENEEAAKNNEVARLREEAAVTGYTPSAWTIRNDDVYSTYLNEDGTFKKEMENVDIQALIDSAKASGDTDTAKKLAVVRGKKILGNYDEFGKWAKSGDVSYVSPQRTAEYDLMQQQIKSAENIAKGETDAKITAANAEAAASKYTTDAKNQTDLTIAQLNNLTKEKIAEMEKDTNNKPALTLQQAEAAIKKGNITQGVIDAYNHYYSTNYTVDNPPNLSGSTMNPTGNTPNTTSTKKYGVDEKLISVGAFDNSKATNVDLGVKGEKTVKQVISLVTNNELGVDGYISSYDLADYLISNSDANDTNKAQLKKIFSYFGLDTKMLDNVEDAGFWFWEWDKGVKTIK